MNSTAIEWTFTVLLGISNLSFGEELFFFGWGPIKGFFFLYIIKAPSLPLNREVETHSGFTVS